MKTSSAGIRINLVEAGDSRWDEVVATEHDPYRLRAIVAAHHGETVRAVMLDISGPGWRATYPLLLVPIEGGHLARTPTYGGPCLTLDAGVDPTGAASALRDSLDSVLRAEGVVSEVIVLSPWTPYIEVVAGAWRAAPANLICTLQLTDREARWGRIGSSRRSEVRRLDREGDVRWEPFSEAQASRFASVYAHAMEGLNAAERWRLDEAYFQRLAAEARGSLRLSIAETATGGAAALFLFAGRRAAYFLAARWGSGPGAASAALWKGIVELGDLGLEDLLLGGGNTEDPRDSLLHFKRSFADREIPVLVAARVYNAAAHQRAVEAGLARPLPPGALAAGY